MKPSRSTGRATARLLLVGVIAIFLAVLGWFTRENWQPVLQPAQAHNNLVSSTPTKSPIQDRSAQPTASPTAAMAAVTTAPWQAMDGDRGKNLHDQGVLLLALRDGAFTHLFAYHPTYLPLTRLTHQPWDDASPSLSPDGKRLAYRSRQNGYWDLYILDLTNGQQTRLTDTPDFENAPTWSPDGLWLAFERFNGTDLDVYIQSLANPSDAPIQLTQGMGFNYAPAWSPNGREIAFVSTLSGNEEIWLARLDDVNQRFINISHNPLARQSFPAWSPDGAFLAWASEKDGDRQLVLWDSTQPDQPAHPIAAGDRPVWDADGSLVYSEVRQPNATGFIAYAAATGQTRMPLTSLPGAIDGMAWVKGPLQPWFEAFLSSGDNAPAPSFWQPTITQTVSPPGRMGLSPLPDVSAPQAMLQDAVDEGFNSLRQGAAAETGWDVLSSLENAFVPLTSPPAPTLQKDWLYTGRAFAFNPLLVSAGWVTIVREDFNGQTFWRVYLKARYQDGSMGQPLRQMTWDLNARFAGDPSAYEQGGKAQAAPSGYWIDFTELASRYGWERLPSWVNWRTFYPSIRFNQFVITNGLSWEQAMTQLYPPEALSTSTPVPTATAINIQAPPNPARAATEAPSPTFTNIPTRRPTWTPLPGPSTP